VLDAAVFVFIIGDASARDFILWAAVKGSALAYL
jgi:hypothetical protein